MTAAVARDIAAGELGNARVITADFGHLPADLGTFDFLALHGVYSWVAPSVRDEILAAARERLAPGGLLLVSYNAMPGWAHLQPIRGILRQYAALRTGDSGQRVRDAVAYLVFMRDKHAKYFEDNPRAAAYVDALVQQDPRYLVHEDMNEHWTSFYFAEVAGAFGQEGLSFVGSLPVYTNFWDLCGTAGVPGTVSDHHESARDRGPQGFLCQHGLSLGHLRHITAGAEGCERPTAGSGRSPLPRHAGWHHAALPDESRCRHLDGAGAALSGTPGSADRPEPAADSLGGRSLALASTCTGTGHSLGDLDAAILHELVERGRDGLALRVAARLEASGRTLQQNGQPVSDASQRSRLVEEACQAFIATSLPELVRLGIVIA